MLYTRRILNSPQRLWMLPQGQAKFPVHCPYGFFNGPFSQLSDIFDPCAHDIVIASTGPGKVSCADNGQLGIFVAHFCNFLPQCCAAKNYFLVWKSVKGNQERTEKTLFANAKVSQELDVHLSVLFYVAMSKRLEIKT